MNPMSLVLVVEDEPDIREMLEVYLRKNGYRTEQATDGGRAWQLFLALRPDLVLLDVQLPGVDGLELLRRIRSQGNTPVIMVTARSEDLDKLLGLELGADDYVSKPFSAREVVARVKAVLRRNKGEAMPDFLRVGSVEIDLGQVSAKLEGQRLDLTLTEFRLLKAMVAAPGRVFTRSELMEAAMPDSDALERAVDVHLKNLRRKFESAGKAELLETVRGLGYRLSVKT
jgi:two-component system response regulator AdeR